MDYSTAQCSVQTAANRRGYIKYPAGVGCEMPAERWAILLGRSQYAGREWRGLKWIA